MSSKTAALERLRTRPWTVLVVALVLLVTLAGTTYVFADPKPGSRSMPQSAAIEDQYGIRFSRLAVVGDGGLLTLSYVVLDTEKATRFQSDVDHPPALRSDARKGGTTRASRMRQGHDLKPGITYFLVYENTRGAIRSGERATITVGDLKLKHVPVL